MFIKEKTDRSKNLILRSRKVEGSLSPWISGDEAIAEIEKHKDEPGVVVDCRILYGDPAYGKTKGKTGKTGKTATKAETTDLAAMIAAAVAAAMKNAGKKPKKEEVVEED